MADLVKSPGRRATDPLRRRLGGGQFRVRGLERHHLAEQLVVLGIADLGRVLAVIELVGAIDLRGKRRVTRRGSLDVELGRGLNERWVDRRKRDGHRCEGTEPRLTRTIRTALAEHRSGAILRQWVDRYGSTRMITPGSAAATAAWIASAWTAISAI